MPIRDFFRNALNRRPDIVQSATINELKTGDTLEKMELNSKN